MENKHPTAVVKLGDKKAKFLIGEAIGDSVAVLYYNEVDVEGALKDGQIVDEEKISKALSTFANLNDEELRLKVSTQTVAMVYPPIGLEIYQSVKSSHSVGEDIAPIDISNVMSLVNKERVPNANQIVDIVPDFFTLDNGKHYYDPPLGERSSSLVIQTKVYTLPSQIAATYKRVVSKAGFVGLRGGVGPYLCAQLLQSDPEVPKDCFYCDIGASLTTVSLLSRGSPIRSLTFRNAGDDIDKAIAKRFPGMALRYARALKEAYGYSPILSEYQGDIGECKDPETKAVQKIGPRALNEVLKAHFQDFGTFLINAVASLIEATPVNSPESKAFLNGLPIILGGGTSQMEGMLELLEPYVGTHPMSLYVPKVPGAYDPSLTEMLGMVLVASRYRGSLGDDYHRVNTLSRGK